MLVFCVHRMDNVAMAHFNVSFWRCDLACKMGVTGNEKYSDTWDMECS